MGAFVTAITLQMIVIGTDVVENDLADHPGHKGIKAARSQYQAWLNIVIRANSRNPEEVKASYPKASILKGGRLVFNIKRQRLPTGSGPSVSDGSRDSPVLWKPCRIP
jgi:mRNA-degrading endonuclease HigB of HigAB toxin-antitoxin module